MIQSLTFEKLGTVTNLALRLEPDNVTSRIVCFKKKIE